MTEKSIPHPLYPCHFCSERHSHFADELFWSEVFQAWVCDICWYIQDKHWDHEVCCEYGISLEEELKNRKQFMAELYEIEGTARIDGKSGNTSKVTI